MDRKPKFHKISAADRPPGMSARGRRAVDIITQVKFDEVDG
jgi:hypothetical protein